MAIQPIDLQVLFSRLDNIGRESTAAQQAAAQEQDVAGREIAEQSRATMRRVREAEEVPDGPERVSEDEEQATSQEERSRDTKGEDGETDSRGDSGAFKDPDLGQTIDLSG